MTETLRGTAFLDALEDGSVRVAERQSNGTWLVHDWVKQAILEIFRDDEISGHWVEGDRDAPAAFRDKSLLSVRRFDKRHDVRLVPGGSAVRRGAHLEPGVVCMPPMYVNIGAFVGAGSMIDSHALVGSCAQLGERVHLSAGAQIGGVLEPIGARPVIVEDDAFIGGNAAVFEGVLIRSRAVLGAGVVLTATTRVFDLVNETELDGTRDEPLEIPEGAVVVPGTRPARGAWAEERGLQTACAMIVKYRDERTSGATALEDALR